MSYEIKRQAKENLMGNKGKAILACLIVSAILSAFSAVGSAQIVDKAFDEMASGEFNITVITSGSGLWTDIQSGIQLLLAGALNIGLATFFINLCKQKDARLEDIFAGFKDGYFVKGIIINFLEGLFVALWTLLLIVPGIVKSLAYSMSYYVALDNPEMSGYDCLKESERLMKGFKGQLFGLYLSFIGWYLLVIISFGIASIWLTPLMHEAKAVFYTTIVKAKNDAETPAFSDAETTF